jgi:hypothetical protein
MTQLDPEKPGDSPQTSPDQMPVDPAHSDKQPTWAWKKWRITINKRSG